MARAFQECPGQPAWVQGAEWEGLARRACRRLAEKDAIRRHASHAARHGAYVREPLRRRDHLGAGQPLLGITEAVGSGHPGCARTAGGSAGKPARWGCRVSGTPTSGVQPAYFAEAGEAAPARPSLQPASRGHVASPAPYSSARARAVSAV
jgi:hypothetical protein